MITLYITSTTPYAGKSALCAGLGKRFQRDGYKIGYMRPLTTSKTIISECVWMRKRSAMRQILGLTDPADAIWPICLDPASLETVLRGGGGLCQKGEKRLCPGVQGKDIVLLEGGSRSSQGLAIGLSADKIARMTDAKVLVVPNGMCPP